MEIPCVALGLGLLSVSCSELGGKTLGLLTSYALRF
jgi:hypothetical protein